MLKQILKEFKYQDRSGLYGLIQKEMAYNSNRIEGSRLSENHTATLFETGVIYGNDGEVYVSKDIEEMTGHFKMFNEMLKNANKPLTQDMIKAFHYQLKSGVFEDIANGRPIGEYKNRQNTVAGITTAEPSTVENEMAKLLSELGNVRTVEDIATFHCRFETIHPFQDGNGRVGRMIMLKQSLDKGLLPIIVSDAHKLEYYASLNAYEKTGRADALAGFLKDEAKSFYDKAKPFIDRQISL